MNPQEVNHLKKIGYVLGALLAAAALVVGAVSANAAGGPVQRPSSHSTGSTG